MRNLGNLRKKTRKKRGEKAEVITTQIFCHVLNIIIGGGADAGRGRAEILP